MASEEEERKAIVKDSGGRPALVRENAGMFRAPPTLKKLDSGIRFSAAGKRYSRSPGPDGRPSWLPLPLIDEEELATMRLSEMSFDSLEQTFTAEDEPAPMPSGSKKSRDSMNISFMQGITKTVKEKIKWHQRKKKGGSFARTRHSQAEVEARKSEVVMATPSAEDEPWEACLEPGFYNLSDVVKFPDVDTPIPKYAKFWAPRENWRSSHGSGSGTVAINHQELRRKIPIETATDVLLRFYNCHLVSDKCIGHVELHDEHVIQDFAYSRDYFKKYVTGVGAGIEVHDFAHIDCPLSPLEESGFFLLGKWIEDGEDTFLCLTMFRVPQLHALYVPGGTYHSNDYLQGTWRTMLSWTAQRPIDHVTLSSIQDDRSEKKDYFRIKDYDHLA